MQHREQKGNGITSCKKKKEKEIIIRFGGREESCNGDCKRVSDGDRRMKGSRVKVEDSGRRAEDQSVECMVVSKVEEGLCIWTDEEDIIVGIVK